MKKKLIIGGIIGLLIMVSVGVLYVMGVFETKKAFTPTPPKDLTGVVVTPVQFSMRGKTFVVPQSDQVVMLDLVAPSSKRDYPMGRFTTASGTAGMLVAHDDFATAIESNVQVVPIALSFAGGVPDMYLAIIEGADAAAHVASLPIGTNVTLRGVERKGNEVTVSYAVHDRNQAPGESPRVETAAIFDVVNKVVVQTGRDPRQEIPKVVKVFTGAYLWQSTESVAGGVTSPVIPNVYGIRFDANRIEITTDCNSASAEFVPPEASSTALTFTNMAMTEMFCEKTQEADFFAMLGAVVSYTESDGGTLEFGLKTGDVMTFIPKNAQVEFESSDANPDTAVSTP